MLSHIHEFCLAMILEKACLQNFPFFLLRGTCTKYVRINMQNRFQNLRLAATLHFHLIIENRWIQKQAHVA